MSNAPPSARIVGTALWRRSDVVSLEYFRLQEFSDGYNLDGRVLTVFEDRPAEVSYSVLCGRDWVTRHAQAVLGQGAASRKLELRRDDEGRWWREGTSLPDVAGASDIDLSITPATNTLPIRRLALDVGASASADAAWVRFPELVVERLPQQYLRTADRTYHYESGGGVFSADLEVDEAGVVVRYANIWERIAPQRRLVERQPQ